MSIIARPGEIRQEIMGKSWGQSNERLSLWRDAPIGHRHKRPVSSFWEIKRVIDLWSDRKSRSLPKR
jgi:hypothetical protein